MCKRNPTVACLLLLVVFLLIAGTGLSTYLAWEAQQALDALVHEKRNNAKERALMAATGGDLLTAQQAITEAEQLGVSKGQILLLRGQVALHHGKTNEALRHLNEAVELLPNSVAARSMLLVAYAYDGQWDKYASKIGELDALAPRTAEDFLFKGYAQGQHDPAKGLQEIENAIRRRPSMIGNLLRAEIQVWHAQGRGTVAEAERAIEYAQSAKRLLRGNAMAIWVSLHARVVAAGIYKVRGQQAKARLTLEKAKRDAVALEEFTDKDAKVFLPDAVVYRWLYYRELGRELDVLPELRRATTLTRHVYVAFYYAVTLFRKGDRQSALNVLKSRTGRYLDCLELFLVAEENGPKKAADACRELATRSKDGLTQLDAHAVRLLLSEQQKKDAITDCKKLLKHPERFSKLRRDRLMDCVKIVAEPIADAVFERQVRSSKWDQCLADYYWGMKYLSIGDRKMALKHFTRAYQTRAFGWFAYDLCWVLKTRLEEDENWPPWDLPSSK